MTRTLRCLLAASIAVPAVLPLPAQFLTQTVPAGWDSGAGGGGSAYPFNSTSSHIWQWHYDSTQFQFAGPIYITEVYVRTLNNAQCAAFNFPSVEVVMASSPTDYTILGNATTPGHNAVFAANLNPDATTVRPAAPWTAAAPVPGGTWMALGMQTPFFYNPQLGNDFVVQIRKCGTVTAWGTSIFGITCCTPGQGGNRYGDTASCTSTSHTFSNNEYVPIVLIDYLPAGPPEYQENQLGAAMAIDNVTGGPYLPALVTLPVNQNGTLALSSTAAGQPWELVIGTAPLVPLSGGAIQSANSHILNVSLADPTLLLLWNFFQSPPMANVSFPVSFPAPIGLSTQLAVVDPVQSGGLSFSQPTRLTVQ